MTRALVAADGNTSTAMVHPQLGPVNMQLTQHPQHPQGRLCVPMLQSWDSGNRHSIFGRCTTIEIRMTR
jgi:hypothetical protein